MSIICICKLCGRIDAKCVSLFVAVVILTVIDPKRLTTE
jgi:hypothetical protein